MLGCIWSCPTDQMLQFPVATMIRFCHNHGLIQVTNRPQWFSVVGGARHYVEKILAGVHDKRLNTPVRLIERDAQGVRIITDGHAERFDEVVIATHTDQALGLLREPSGDERSVLGAIRYQDNRAVLHTDASKTTNEIERGGSVGFTLPVARLGVADQQIVQTWAPARASEFPTIGYDNALAARLLVDHLVGLGHRDIGIVAGQTRHNDRVRARVAGLRVAMRRHRLSLPADRIVQTEYKIAR
jgi:hypothetical protein